MRPTLALKTTFCAAAVATAVAWPFASVAQGRMEDIVVTATRIPRNLEDIAGTVSVVTDDELERQVAQDLDDLVRYQAGVSMDTAARGGNQGFIIRGIGGNRVLTLIDGVRAADSYNAVVSGYGKDLFDVDDLESVEIIRGPASVLYGADALGGVVILRGKAPRDYLTDGDARHFGARVAGSSANDQYKVGLSGAVRGDRRSALVQYTRREFAERDVNADVLSNPIDGRSDSLIAKALLAPNKDHEIELVLDGFVETVASRLNTELGPTVTRSAGDDETERYRISVEDRWRADLPFADEIDTHLFHQSTDALQHTAQTLTTYSFVDPVDFSSYGGTEAERVSDFEFNQKIRGLGLTLSKALARGAAAHSLVYGLSVDETETERPRNRCETEIATGAFTCSIAPYPFADPEVFPNRVFPDTTTTRSGLFVQNEMIFGDGRVTVIPGLRYDRYEMKPTIGDALDGTTFGFDVAPVDEDEVTANLGIIYTATDRLGVFVQYAEGFRPPNFEEANQAFVNRAFGYATVPNPDLRPETSRGLELGIKANRERLRFSASVFRNRYRDFIDTQFVAMQDGISLFQQRNIGEAEIRGAELTALWSLSERWSVHGALAYAHGNDELDGVPLDSVDPLNGVLGMRYASSDDRWGIEALLTSVADKDRVSSEDVATADGYSVVDLVGHVRIANGSTLRLGVYNLFDEAYARWANVQGLPVADLDAIARAAAPGTNLRMTLTVDF